MQSEHGKPVCSNASEPQGWTKNSWQIVLWNVRLYEDLKWQTKRYKPHIYYIYIYTFCAASKTHGGITPYCGIQTRIGTSQSLAFQSTLSDSIVSGARCPKGRGGFTISQPPNFSKQTRIPATKQTTHPNKKVVIDMNSPSGPLQHIFTDPIALHVIYQANYYNS